MLSGERTNKNECSEINIEGFLLMGKCEGKMKWLGRHKEVLGREVKKEMRPVDFLESLSPSHSVWNAGRDTTQGQEIVCMPALKSSWRMQDLTQILKISSV